MSWTPREGDSHREWNFLPLTAGSSLTVRVLGRAGDEWPNPGNPAFVGFIGVDVSERLVGGVQVICKHNRLKLDLGSAGNPHTPGVERKGAVGSFRPGQAFDLTLRLQDGGNGTAAGMVAKMPRKLSGGPVVVRVGQEGVADGAYFPPIGWRIDRVTVDGEEMDLGEQDGGEPGGGTGGDTGGGSGGNTGEPSGDIRGHLAEIDRHVAAIRALLP